MEIYDLLRLVIGIVIAIVFLISVTLYIVRGNSSPLSSASSQIKTSVCGSNADCSDGVCVAGSCACFLDSQCRSSGKCNMGTGSCKT